ncbi:MAG: hypothetical protein J5U17_08385 [Candidatus Methanoperedens sp.]|nr:hypothetical protein [Candidatus Methanoperedens sp.]MCE8428403.1 hypothetical protein [Candidatus Methanoperedens sp.]
MAKRVEEKRVVMLMQWTGVTKELYEKVREEVNWEGEVPEGAVLHIATFDDKGIRVTDVWKSEADLNNFVQNRLMPVTKELIDTEPDIEVHPLHNLFIPEQGEEDLDTCIVLIVKWEGFTKDMYEETRKQVDFEGDVPKGLVLHIVTFNDKGIRVSDIWESEEDFNNYARERLMPVTGKLTETQPDMEVYPLHALFIPGV